MVILESGDARNICSNVAHLRIYLTEGTYILYNNEIQIST